MLQCPSRTYPPRVVIAVLLRPVRRLFWSVVLSRTRPITTGSSKGQCLTQPVYAVRPHGNPDPQTRAFFRLRGADTLSADSEPWCWSSVHPWAAPVPATSAAFPGTSLYLPRAQTVAFGLLGATIPVAYDLLGPICPPGSTVLVEGGYFAGPRSRAGPIAGSIPPPPPDAFPVLLSLQSRREPVSLELSGREASSWVA